MATTKNEYTGDGSTTLFPFTFPYIEESDVVVSVNDVVQTIITEYIFSNATTIGLVTAPPNGASVVIQRQTSDEDLKATFFPGSAIRARDLNDNFTQNLYVTQENTTSAAEANNAAAEAAASAASAAASASSAAADASDAQEAAAEAVTTANAAATAAANAEASAANAETSAAAAQEDAATALAAVSNSLNYILIADVSAIPVSPDDADAVEVNDSTGIESFTPLSGIPAGFVGDPALYVRIVYRTSTASWEWIQYGANDPEARYLASGDNVSELVNDAGYLTSAPVDSVAGKTGTVTLVKADITDLNEADYATAAQGSKADTAVQVAGSTMTGTLGTTERTIAGTFDLSTGNHWTCGGITVPAPTNATAGTSGLIRITAGPVVWNAVFKFPGGAAPTISTFPAVIPFYVQDASNILMGNVAEGIS